MRAKVPKSQLTSLHKCWLLPLLPWLLKTLTPETNSIYILRLRREKVWDIIGWEGSWVIPFWNTATTQPASFPLPLHEAETSDHQCTDPNLRVGPCTFSRSGKRGTSSSSWAGWSPNFRREIRQSHYRNDPVKYDLTFSAVRTPSGSKSYSYPIANTGTGPWGEKELSEVTRVPSDFAAHCHHAPMAFPMGLTWRETWGGETSVIFLVNQPIFPATYLRQMISRRTQEGRGYIRDNMS